VGFRAGRALVDLDALAIDYPLRGGDAVGASHNMFPLDVDGTGAAASSNGFDITLAKD
jgi:hypothetical protein